ncbi:hypothetical protein EBR66_08825 [bacterium]|nr:hypothetical protein [bacterium]
MKNCYRCYIEKPIADFPIRKGTAIGICNACYKQYYGDPNLLEQKRKRLLKENIKRRQQRCQEYLFAILKNSQCCDCGMANPIVLEFDHRIPEEKYKGISEILNVGSIEVLKEEVAKCDIVCANCHRIRTAKTFGSWRLNYVAE